MKARPPRPPIRGSRKPPARAPKRSSRSGWTRPSSPRGRRPWKVNVYNYGPNYVGMVLGSLTLIAVVATVARVVIRGPLRTEVVHTEHRGSWTGRVLRIGPWSDDTQTWTGRSRFDVEVSSGAGAVHRTRTAIDEIDDALVLMRRELDKHVERRA